MPRSLPCYAIETPLNSHYKPLLTINQKLHGLKRYPTSKGHNSTPPPPQS